MQLRPGRVIKGDVPEKREQIYKWKTV
jgi:hypothetical protein